MLAYLQATFAYPLSPGARSKLSLRFLGAKTVPSKPPCPSVFRLGYNPKGEHKCQCCAALWTHD
jgi:hypothetical protein